MSEDTALNIFTAAIVIMVVMIPGIIASTLYRMSRRSIFASHRGKRHHRHNNRGRHVA